MVIKMREDVKERAPEAFVSGVFACKQPSEQHGK